MKQTMISFVILLLSMPHYVIAKNTQDTLINTASLLSGSFMQKTPPLYTATNLMLGLIQNYAPEALCDQSPKLWCSQEGASFPFLFQIELTETFTIHKLEFDNRYENYPGITAKDINIQFAARNHNSLFEDVGTFTLRANDVNSIDIAPREARIIRIEIRSNYGQGHTDSDGGTAHNDKLSRERAAAVQAYVLNEHQIALMRIDIEGRGERFPVSTNDTEFGKATN